jgi:SP family general alpha glucoside:H+ symporter-like MFS transporter
MSHFGRRDLYLLGQTLTFILVLLIGILACIPQGRTISVVSPTTDGSSPQAMDTHPTALNWVIAASLLAFTLTYDATLGPICYALVSEIPSTRLRSKTIVLARNCYNISGIIANIITPRMLNPTAWGWGARTGFFWAGTSIVGIIWSWFRLPEPKDRTFGELDELFERNVAARKFKTMDLRHGERAVDRVTGVIGKPIR